MKNTYKCFFCTALVLIVLGVIGYSWRTSQSVKMNYKYRGFNSINILKNEHVVPYDKVFVKIDGDTNEMKSINLLLASNKTSFRIDLKDINADEPYFELPYYDDNIVAGLKYTISEVVITYKDGEIARFTTVDSEAIHLIIDEKESYFMVDEMDSDANAWRDFKGITFKDHVYSNGVVYLNIYGDTKEMVNIELELVKKDETKNILVNVESLDNRPFINIAQYNVKLGEEYYLKDMTIFYNNGGFYTYNADNYANILNNRIFIETTIEDGELKVDDVPIVEGGDPNAITSTSRSKDVAGGLITLFLIISAVVGIFLYLRREDIFD